MNDSERMKAQVRLKSPSRPLSLASTVVSISGGGVVTLSSLPLKRCVGLVGLVELSEELNIRNK